MHAKWYCRTCNERIERGDIETHEREGHEVKGLLRPDRLLSNDPWTVGDGERPPAAGPTSPEPAEERRNPDSDAADQEGGD